MVGTIVLYLDGACFDEWKTWWLPCIDATSPLRYDIVLAMHWLPGKFDVQALRRNDVCSRSARMHLSCLQSGKQV